MSDLVGNPEDRFSRVATRMLLTKMTKTTVATLVLFLMSLCMRKPTIWVSDLVQHKPACTVTEETQELENLGISRGGNVLSM